MNPSRSHPLAARFPHSSTLSIHSERLHAIDQGICHFSSRQRQWCLQLSSQNTSSSGEPAMFCYWGDLMPRRPHDDPSNLSAELTRFVAIAVLRKRSLVARSRHIDAWIARRRWPYGSCQLMALPHDMPLFSHRKLHTFSSSAVGFHRPGPTRAPPLWRTVARCCAQHPQPADRVAVPAEPLGRSYLHLGLADHSSLPYHSF